jgi:dipeptidase E
MQIIAIGGGGFSEGSEPGLDHYVLEHSRRATPRIGFIGTASGDAENYLLKFYARFAKLDCRPGHLPLFRRTPDLEAWVLGQDVIYVGGGNTKSMLAVWEGWGLASLLSRAGEAGTILTGISAGAICWFDFGVTDSASGNLAPMACLGFVSGSCCPHYSGEVERRPSYERMVQSEELPAGFAIDDGAAIHFVDGLAKRVVVGRATAHAFRVEKVGSHVRSEPLDELERVDVHSGSGG